MAKLSVYVPDGLWEQAKRSGQDPKQKSNNSQVVQRALEQMVTEQQAKRSAFAAGAVIDQARFAQVVAGLRDEATREYERGYSAGLELAEALGFDELRMVINAGGLHDKGGVDWLGSIAEDAGAGDWWGTYGAAFREVRPDNDALLSRSEAFVAGTADALDDVWQALRANSWGTGRADTEEASAEDADKSEAGE